MALLGWGWTPFLAAVAWLGTTIALLVLWLANGAPHYKQDQAKIVYISDVGAAHKTLFIAGAAATSGLFILSLLLNHWFRHSNRLAPHIQRRESVDSVLAMLFGIVAGACLTLLTIFDAFNHKTIHWALTLGFMASLAISAAFTVAEYRRLRKDHLAKHYLARSYRWKIIIVLLAIALVIAMIVLMNLCRNYWDGSPDAGRCDTMHSASAVCEWVVAFLFGLYLLTLAGDLRRSIHSPNTTMAMEAGHVEQRVAWAPQHRGSAATLGPRRAYY